MQSLQGQFVGTHILMDSLKLYSNFYWLNSSGTIPLILGPRYEIFSVPWKTLFTWGVIKSGRLRKLYWLFVYSIKISQITSGHSLCFALNIPPVASACIFLWSIETELSFSKRFSEDDFLSLYISHKHRSCRCLIFFINIQIRGQ